ncbi:MAG: ABC transporter ATP-binding protein [Deltaproteobacteria bacterium]|nr:ABC transporter ATP-binding protein [Deltaproteobacteria bacterium]
MTALEEDKVTTRQLDRRLFWRLFRLGHPYLHLIAAAFFFILLGTASTLAGPIVIMRAIDDHVATGDMHGLTVMALVYLGLLTIEFLAYFLQTYCTGMLGQKVMYDLRGQIFDHLQTLSIPYFDRNPVGRIITRVTNDVENLNQLFTQGIVTIFADIFIIAGIIAVMVYYAPTLALWSFTVLPLLVVATFVFRHKVRKGFDAIRVLLARINSNLQENITGMKTVQLFRRETRSFDIFARINREHTQAHERTILYFALFFPIVDILSAAALALVILKGGAAIGAGALTFGVVFAFIRYLEMFFRPVSDLAEKYNILQSAMASSERIFKLLDKRPEVRDRVGAKELDGPVESVAFENVVFGYNADNPVIRDVSFSVDKGQRVALVGHTGAGKSTVINLLSRFYDLQGGRITVNGTDIGDLTQRSLRSRMAAVLQDPFIFSRTIAENIRLGEERISLDQMREAARIVNANGFIEELPDRYDTMLVERGENISTGQKQLVSFARAMAFDPDLLILDEATANIDTATEALIQAAIAELTRRRTSIIVAHRLSTIQNADKIIVLHHGRKVEEGNHNELLTQRGLYHRLYQLQYKEELIRKRGIASQGR